jgi:hypothetical protein
MLSVVCAESHACFSVMLSVHVLSVVMLSVVCAECCYAECSLC